MGTLTVSDLTAGYGGGPDILNGINLTVEPGRTYCVIGPNGAGKSTLLKTIAGLLRPRSGSIVFGDDDLSRIRSDQILDHGICFVPQSHALFGEMTVRENLEMGAYLLRDRAVIRERIDQVCEMFPILGERRSQPAGNLSGGQQQMLALGRALMIEPKILMLDEPSLGLAPQIADQIFESIGRMAADGMTMIIVEQNVHRGLGAADWGFVLDLGELHFDGPADEILSDERIQELYLGSSGAQL